MSITNPTLTNKSKPESLSKHGPRRRDALARCRPAHRCATVRRGPGAGVALERNIALPTNHDLRTVHARRGCTCGTQHRGSRRGHRSFHSPRLLSSAPTVRRVFGLCPYCANHNVAAFLTHSGADTESEAMAEPMSSRRAPLPAVPRILRSSHSHPHTPPSSKPIHRRLLPEPPP